MNEHLLDEQLRRRLEHFESSTDTAHLAGDLPIRDVAFALLGFVLVTIALLWWAY